MLTLCVCVREREETPAANTLRVLNPSVEVLQGGVCVCVWIYFKQPPVNDIKWGWRRSLCSYERLAQREKGGGRGQHGGRTWLDHDSRSQSLSSQVSETEGDDDVMMTSPQHIWCLDETWMNTFLFRPDCDLVSKVTEEESRWGRGRVWTHLLSDVVTFMNEDKILSNIQLKHFNNTF